jgi:hypothetical protein
MPYLVATMESARHFYVVSIYVQGYIYWKPLTPPPPHPPPREISANVIQGENMKRGREKGGKCKRKMKKGERKKIRVSKRVK